jgi:hypothetical protein
MDGAWSGLFWLADTPDIALPGCLATGHNSAPTVTVEGLFHPMLRLHQEIRHPDGSVSREFGPGPANQHPVTVHGTAEDGTPLTLLEALTTNRSTQGLSDGDSKQQLTGIQAVIGMHLSGRDHRFEDARFHLQTAFSWIASDSQTEHSLADGLLRATLDGETRWLEVLGAPARSIRMWDRAVARPATVLLELASGMPIGVIATQVRERRGSWCSVYSAALAHEDVSYPLPALLEAQDIDLGHVATWLDRAEVLGPLAPVVTNAVRNEGTLETQVLSLATVAEGLHRRLHSDTWRMRPRDAEAARAAVIEVLADRRSPVVDVVRGLLAHLEEPGYRQRLQDLAATTAEAAAGLTGKTAKWVSLVNDARNDFAHRLPKGWLTDEDVDKYATVAYSLRWLLRVRLLQEAGFANSLLRQRLGAFDAYRLLLEHLADWMPSVYGK